MHPVNLKSLTLTEKLGIVYSFAWRSMAVGLCSSLLAALLGFPVGLLMASLDMEELSVVLGAVLGLVIGIAFQWIAIRWLLSARLGGRFRLQLIHD